MKNESSSGIATGSRTWKEKKIEAPDRITCSPQRTKALSPYPRPWHLPDTTFSLNTFPPQLKSIIPPIGEEEC